MLKYGSNNIGKVYLGSNPIGKAYYGSNLVFQKGGGTTPPGPPPTSIAYIRGDTDGAYINTGITADNNTRVIVWARNFNPHCGVLFGSRVANGNTMFGVGAYGGTAIDRIRVDYGNVNGYVDGQYVNMSSYHKYELDGNVFKIDDVTVFTATSATFDTGYNIYLFTMNTSGTAGTNMTAIDICAAKIYKSGILVRDYTAVNTPSVGLYDAVSGTVFTNAGTGSFTYGTFNPNAYTRLEYIETAGSSWFDTGANVTYDDIVVSKFRPTGDTKRVYFLFACPILEFESIKYSYRGYLGNATDLYRRFYVEMSNTVAAGSTIPVTMIYNSTNPNLKDATLVYIKNTNKSRLYKNNSAIGSEGTSSEATSDFVSPNTLVIGDSGTGTETYVGRIYYFGIGSKRALVPAKRGSRIGMYDNYNDVFYTSDTNTPFTEPIV